jgi:uncharacterized protein YbjQ (UPF0145 family)
MNMTKLIVFILGLAVMSGCATANPNQFERIKGRALNYAVAIYQGQPTSEYPYRSLGSVTGYFKGESNILYSDMVVYVMDKSLEDMANNAKAMGANAVINIKGNAEMGLFKEIYHYTGEAVVFGTLPSDK